jgi:hypothetical protein
MNKGMGMKARIYQPAKTAMQSGTANTRQWLLEFEPESGKQIDSLMGWVGSSDTRGQLRMKFASVEDAKSYAKRHDILVEVQKPHVKKRRIQAYSDNFK